MASVLGARANARQNPNLPAGQTKLPSAMRRSQSTEKLSGPHKMSYRDIVQAQVNATLGANHAQESPPRFIH
jgi:hypothetical protein